MEIQEESPTCDIGKNDEEVNTIFKQQTAEDIMEIDIQTIEKTSTDRKYQNNEDTVIISPIFEQQATEKEEKKYSEQENEEVKHKYVEFRMDTIFEHPTIKMKKKNYSKNNKKIEKLELR